MRGFMLHKNYNSMDLLAEAILEQKFGSKEKFFFINQKEEFEHDTDRYYVKPFLATELENNLFNLCNGNILDIGSATGNYFPKLMERGNVIGIEQSRRLIKLAKKDNLDNIKMTNIFSYKTTKKFDTITLLENNLGLGGNLAKTTKLIKILLKLVKKDGRILAIISKRAKKNYYIVKICGRWKQKIGKPINWLNIHPNILKKICKQNKATLNILAEDKKNFLIKITIDRI